MLIRCSDIYKIPFFLTRNHNGFEDEVPIYYYVLNQLNIAGNVLTVTDALDRTMTTNYYDMTGQLIYNYNIDSGRRWMIYDIANKPLRLWDNRNSEMQYEYDVLQRPTKTKLKENGSSSAVTVESIVYGTSATSYRKGKPEFIYDQSGKTNYSVFDFKGNPLTIIKQYTEDYDITIDWDSSPAPTLETETFTTEFTYDAMNRPTGQTKPDDTVEEYTYNKAGLLETISAQIRGDSNWTDFITNINYNEKGQRTDVYFGNNSKTGYTYDTNTFRLKTLITTRNTGNVILQNLTYTYDPVGNIVQQTDTVLPTIYFNNSIVSPTCLYEYDPLYRLISATGRELTALAKPDVDDFVNNLPVPNTDTSAVQNYTQTYSYDALGNIEEMSSGINWTRDYFYETENNQLIGHVDEQTDYTYDAHGNILSMPHLSAMEWDYANRLKKTVRGTTTTYYCYDVNGVRTRKVSEKQGSIKEVRSYLGGYEVFRKYISNVLDIERQTLHIDDDKKKVALVETLTVEDEDPITTPVPVIRYQYDNHLGSACLELSSTAAIISYEEYHPFGTTSYRSGSSEAEVSLKRYKYVGKERDEETGLYYYGARYYAAWLCRFISVDPMAVERNWLSPYNYCSLNPINRIDPTGALDDGWELKRLKNGDLEYNKISDIGGNDFQVLYYTNEFEGESSTKDPRRDTQVKNWSSKKMEQWLNTTVQMENKYMADERYKAQFSKMMGDFVTGFEKTLFNIGCSAACLPLLELSFVGSSVASGIADFASQMTFNGGNINNWNISGTLGTAIFKNPFAQAGFGSFLEVRVSDIKQETYFQHSILGEKPLSQALIQTGIGGTFNYFGGKATDDMGLSKFGEKMFYETPALYLDYSISNSLQQQIGEKK